MIKNKYNISNILSIILIILAICGLIIPIIIGLSNLALLGSYLAVPMILGPIAYKLHRKKTFADKKIDLKKPDNQMFSILLILYSMLLFISIIFLIKYEVRPIIYYFAIATLSTLILLEILLFDISKNKSLIIISQIMILILNIIYGVTLKYYFFISRTDPIGHVQVIKDLVEKGHVTDIFGIYKPFPLWHILCSSLQYIMGISPESNKVMFLANGLIYAFIVPVAYKTYIYVFKDQKIALIASLFTVLIPSVISYGMSSISRSVVSFLELMIIFLLMFHGTNTAKQIKLLLILLTFATILYHTASMPFILLILLIYYAFLKLYRKEDNTIYINSNYILLAFVLTVSYWIFHAQLLFETLIRLVVIPAPKGILTKSIVYTPLNELFNYLQYTPMLFFIIFGILWALQSNKISKDIQIWCIIGFIAAGLSFPGPALLINKLAGDFNLSRFGEYSFFFIAAISAYGLYKLNDNAKKYMKTAIIIIFFIMSLLSVSNDFTATDNPLVKRPFYTYYLTEEEITAFENVPMISNGFIMTDHATQRYIQKTPFEPIAHILEIGDENSKFLRNSTSDLILIRNGELKKRPLRLYESKNEMFILDPSGKTNLKYCEKDLPIWNTLNEYNKVYYCGNVSCFI